jgi:hypothetical protein
MSGQLFLVNCCDATFTVPQADGLMRLWRNTSVASLPVGGTATLQAHTLGYDRRRHRQRLPPGGHVQHVDQHQRHAGGVHRRGNTSHRSGHAPSHDVQGAQRRPRVRCRHHPVGLRARQQARWPGDDGRRAHEAGHGEPPRRHERPAADAAGGPRGQAKTTDTTAPTITITSPAANASINNGAAITVSGTAIGAGGRVGGVEVSSTVAPRGTRPPAASWSDVLSPAVGPAPPR